MRKNLCARYNPLYFLAALGNGGLAVAFFMYPMFMIKHPGYPMPTFEHIAATINGGNKIVPALVILALSGIVFFAFNHFRLLLWNLREYRLFKQTEAFTKLKQSNAEVSLMAIPLTLSMSINVSFTLGAVFVPGLWNHVEALFPFSLAAFLAIGVYALKIYTVYFSRIIFRGDFDFVNNNNLSQLIGIFAFAMISVGLAAPAAMSHTLWVSATAMFFSIMFASITAMLAVIKLVIGFKSIFRYGIAQESSPTLWITIPIITVFGIAMVRLISGVSHNLLHREPSPAGLFVMLSVFLSVQILFGIIGYLVLRKNNYFNEYIHGEKKSPGSYTMICPGVAFFVLGMFFIYWGLVKTNILPIFSPAYFIILAPFILIKLKTIQTLFRLNRKLLSEDEAYKQQPALTPGCK